MARLRSLVPLWGGVLDAGFVSAATFAAGLAAVSLLPLEAVGVYAIVFRAFTLIALLPTNLVCRPIELGTLRRAPAERLGVIETSVLRALSLSVPVGLVLVAATLIMATTVGAGFEVWLPLGLTAAGLAVVSPVQDHLRRLLHLADKSMQAGLVSAIHLLTVLAVLGVGWGTGLPASLLPFGALLVANLTSLSIGYWRLNRTDAAPWEVGSLPSLMREGRWLLTQEASPVTTTFLSNLLVAGLGLEVLGIAEATRVVAQPVRVLGEGIARTLEPRSMEAALRRERSRSMRLRRQFWLAYLPAGALFAVWVLPKWPLNPFVSITPAAYALEGLLALQISALVVSQSSLPIKGEALGLRRFRALTKVDLSASGLRLLTVVTLVGLLGAYVLPVSNLVGASTLLLGRIVIQRSANL